MNKRKRTYLIGLSVLFIVTGSAFTADFLASIKIPKSLSNLSYEGSGDSTKMVLSLDGKKYERYTHKQYIKDRNPWVLSQFDEVEKGTKDGIALQFGKDFNGTLIYGLYSNEPMKYPLAVYFRKHAKIEHGKAEINIRKNLSGRYDLAHWETRKKGRLAYRVLDEKNNVIFNKSISFTVGDVFSVVPDLTWGPFLSSQTKNSIAIHFATNLKCKPVIEVNGKSYSLDESKMHEIVVDGLEAGKTYNYVVKIGDIEHKAQLQTAPKINKDARFTFAFASDSRGGTQLGESNAQGHNADIIRKMAALAVSKKVAFWQFTGDMINGYKLAPGQINYEYTGWLTTLSPFMHSTPLNVGMGNHEVSMMAFGDPRKWMNIDAFPYDKNSGEKLFSNFFVNPQNGPESEDGSKYDPDKKTRDFPSYKENVYSYVYGNMAMIVLNSNYWYTPNQKLIKDIGGNVHGYVMDNQLEWLRGQIKKFEKMDGIQHIFVTIHTPAFPNGGHAGDDMWYNGNNEVRPWVAGKAVEKGIIERRDEILDLLVNQSKKFRVLLTGDEHNYTRLVVDENTQRYPENWEGKRLKLSRPFVQIVDGASGAPYYAQQQLPWTPSLKKFSAQYALVLFHIDGAKIEVEVLNPNTLELIEKTEL